MRLGTIRHLYGRDGPFLNVHLDVSRDNDAAGREVLLGDVRIGSGSWAEVVEVEGQGIAALLRWDDASEDETR